MNIHAESQNAEPTGDSIMLEKIIIRQEQPQARLNRQQELRLREQAGKNAKPEINRLARMRGFQETEAGLNSENSVTGVTQL
jgi:hypothetical protein